MSGDSNLDCALCGDNGRQKLRYATWGETERTYLEKHLGASLDNSALVCKKHFLEAKRHCQNSEHIPSWKSKAKFADPSGLPLTERCSNPKCENTAPQRLIRPMFTTNDKLAEIFQTEHTEEPFVLCRQCYNKAHATICPPSCSSCGAYPKTGTTFSRHSPDAVKISQHFSNASGETVTITPSDNICFNCYKTHCSIIESFKSQHGSDTMLQHSIHEWVSKKTDDNTDRLTKAILDTVIYVANNLLLGKSVLLPWASKVFLHAYDAEYTSCITSTPRVSIVTGESCLSFSGKWLLHQLILYLNSYMLYKCMHMKFGTILYRKGIDVLVSLSWALSAQSTPEETVVLAHITPTKQQSDKVTVLHDAAYLVNDLIHEEIDRQSTVKSSPISFDIDSELEQINPLLLKFINSITATIRERKHPALGKPNDSSKHLKKVRIYNILGLLQFCTNPN